MGTWEGRGAGSQETESRKQKAESRKQKAESRKQKAATPSLQDAEDRHLATGKGPLATGN
jgi:hypothetical protein